MRRDVGGWMVRWHAEMAARAVAQGDWPNRTVAELAQERATTQPARVLIVDGELALTCGALYERAQRLAGFFLAQGLCAGAVVSFQLPNWWEASVINLAAAMIGVVVNPIVPINRDAEVTHMLNESATRLLFIPSVFRRFDYAAMLRRIAPALKSAPRIVLVRGTSPPFEEFETMLRVAAPLPAPLAVDPNAVKLLMYTSGTTGRPKGVLHTHNTIHADAAKMTSAMALGDADITFCPSPLTHVSGYLWVLNMPWYGNIPAVTVDTWDPEQAFDRLAQHRCTFMVGATPFLQDLVATARRRAQTLPDLRYYLCGGAAVPPSLIYEAAEVFPRCIPWRTFGATEAPTLTAPPASRHDLRYAAETDGRLYRAEAKVVGIATGEPVASGGEGEILVREASMAIGYARLEDNEGSYDHEGYFRMGDLVRIVDGDHILCTGRKKDLIIRAGENISPKEIEDVLYRSPKILEAAVVAMPSRRTGEAICAFIVPRAGESLDLAEVAALIGGAGLARQKTPEHLQLMPALPKNPAGKVRKDQLREMARGYANP